MRGFGSFGDLVEGVGDRGVVGSGGGEGLLAQSPASFAAESAALLALFISWIRCGIVGDASDDGDIFEVFGGGADHGRAADVDVFDEVAEGDAGLRGGLLEGVEVDDDHVDGLDVVGGDGGFVFGIAANVEQSAVDARVQGLHAAVEHLGKAGEVADVLDGRARLAKGAGGAAGGDQLDAEACEDFCELHEAGFVGHAEQRAPNRFGRIRRWTQSSAPCGLRKRLAAE